MKATSRDRPAGIGGRIAAFILDGVAVLVLGFGVLSLAGVMVGPSATVDLVDPRAASVELGAPRATANAILVAAVSALYFVGSWVRHGRTLGQRALGIRVRPSTGSDERGPHLTTARAAWRWALLGSPFGIASAGTLDAPLAFVAVSIVSAGWMVALLATTVASRGHRGLHDRLSGSIVLRDA